MSNHVSEWLNAYFDGELTGRQLHQVEEHLTQCAACQAELDSLQGLSELLHEVPAPEFTSPDRFAARVNLLLPHERMTTSGKKLLDIGWWMIPVGLLAAWVFIGTTGFVSDILSTANNLGIMTSISDWVVFGSLGETSWSAALGQFGVLSGESLGWAELTEVFTRTSLPQIILQVSIALLYLGWIAIWWARQTHHARQPHGQLPEG